jgi:hypothetical protein
MSSLSDLLCLTSKNLLQSKLLLNALGGVSKFDHTLEDTFTVSGVVHIDERNVDFCTVSCMYMIGKILWLVSPRQQTCYDETDRSYGILVTWKLHLELLKGVSIRPTSLSQFTAQM